MRLCNVRRLSVYGACGRVVWRFGLEVLSGRLLGEGTKLKLQILLYEKLGVAKIKGKDYTIGTLHYN